MGQFDIIILLALGMVHQPILAQLPANLGQLRADTGRPVICYATVVHAALVAKVLRRLVRAGAQSVVEELRR